MYKMSVLPADEQCFFAYFAEVVHNCEQSSDGGSASNSDAEPEVQDSDSDESVNEAAVQDNQIISERDWQCVAPTGNNNETVKNLSETCSLTRKSEHVQTLDECFHLFIDEEIIHNIIFYTNMKAIESMPANKKWKLVDNIEMNAFFGLLLLMGRFRESRECKNDLWEKNEALSRRFYTAVMSRDRFTDILKYLRFDDTATRVERKSNDKLAPLRHITNIFVQNCQDSYEASGIGCIDEQLVAFRGRCSFKVSMSHKPGKCGIKLWTLCDAKTFYCCNTEVYLGKHGNTPEVQPEQRAVKRLTDYWKGSGRCVTANNCFTDLSLGEELLENNIYLVGIIWKNKQDIPKTLVETRNRLQYSSEFLFTEKLTLVSYVPEPRKSVTLLSTLHHKRNVSTAADNFKPDIFNYYNSTRSTVDDLDKILKEHSCRRSTRRWALALFMHYIDVAAYNAFVIWHTKYPTWNNGSSLQKKRKTFLEELSRKLTAENIDRRATEFENQEIGLHKNVLTAIEATGRKIVKNLRLSGQKRARCCFCIGSNNKYSTVCDDCKRHVCSAHSVQSRSIICSICSSINAK